MQSKMNRGVGAIALGLNVFTGLFKVLFYAIAMSCGTFQLSFPEKCPDTNENPSTMTVAQSQISSSSQRRSC